MATTSKEIELNSVVVGESNNQINEDISSFVKIPICDTESDEYISEDNDENLCVICLEDLDKGEPIHFHCGHIFHIHCILDWIVSLFQKNADISCPICRYVECYSDSPHYRVLKTVIGFNDRDYDNNHMINNNREVQRRLENNHQIIYTNQRVYQDNQQQYEDGLNRMFFTFIKLICILLIAFLIFLIYSIRNN